MLKSPSGLGPSNKPAFLINKSLFLVSKNSNRISNIIFIIKLDFPFIPIKSSNIIRYFPVNPINSFFQMFSKHDLAIAVKHDSTDSIIRRRPDAS